MIAYSSGSTLRLAELIAAASLATDLGMGQPMGHALRTTLLAVELGSSLGVSDRELADIYYVALLRFIGCTADAHDFAEWFGDEIATRRRLAIVDLERPSEAMGFMIRHLGQSKSPLGRARMVVAVLAAGPRKVQHVAATRVAAHCEVAQQLAERLGFSSEVRLGLAHAFERWDGRGMPGRLKGEAIALPARVALLARDVDVFRQVGGMETAVSVVRKRAGAAYDPKIAERFCQDASRFLEGLQRESAWEAVLAAEPGQRLEIPDARLDTATRAIADFVDLKSPYTLGHSTGVGELAEAAARRLGLLDEDIATIRRAGFLHDLGRVGVSNHVWDKPGALTDGEWEQVRLHPYYTERVLARPPALAKLGAVAALHHERLDGSGYHRRAPASLQPISARILAAADVYHAMIETRPHRLAHPPGAAADELRSEVRAGRIDRDAATAVLDAAGHPVRARPREWAAGLSDREVEVLRLAAKGLSNHEMARILGIADKTVGHHIQHIYNKIGVSTRAGATLFALQHDLLRD